MNIIDVTDKIHPNNYSKAVIVPLGICLHITTDTSRTQSLNWFKDPDAEASSHDIIVPNGDVLMCVASNRKAYHAGIKEYPTAQIVKDNKNRNPNNYLIGIEVVAKKNGTITDAQFESLKSRVLMFCETYNIPLDRYHIIGHNEINTIDKVFCPVSVYNPSQVILGILTDKKINKLTETVNRLKEEAKDFDEKLLLSEFEQDRLSKIIRKVREQYSNLKLIYEQQVRTIQSFRNRKDS